MSRGMHYRSRYKLELTPRQREVLDLIAKGQTNAEIATRLDLSLDGVKWHVREILGKLAVDSREEAAALWRDYNRPAARLARGLGGLFAFGTLKTAIAGAGLLAVDGAALAFYLGLHDSGSGAKADPASSQALGGPPCTSTEVSLRPEARQVGGLVQIYPGIRPSGECVLAGDLVIEIRAADTSTVPQISGNPVRTKFEAVKFPAPPPGGGVTVSLAANKYAATWSNWCDGSTPLDAHVSIGTLQSSARLTVTPDCTSPGKPSELRLGAASQIKIATPAPSASASDQAEHLVTIDSGVRAFAEQLAASVTRGDVVGVMALATPRSFTCPAPSPPPGWPYPVCDGLSPGTKVDGYTVLAGSGPPQYVSPDALKNDIAALPPLELASIACRAGESECTLDKTFLVGFKNASGPAVFFVLNPTPEGARISGLGQADDPRITAGGRLDIWPGSVFYVPLK